MKARAQRTALAIAVVLMVTAGTTVQAADGWLWSITPYVWASDISESLLIRDEIEGGSDTSFSDLVEIADTTLQIHFEGVKDHWGMFADYTYVELSDSKVGEMEILRLDVDITETVLEAGAIYRPGGRSGNFDLLFGVRQLTVDEKYNLQIGQFGPFESRIDEGYVDALVGARYRIPLSDRWVISLRGDVSAGGTDYMWTAHGILGWRFGAKRNSAIFVGYQYRDMEFTKGEIDVKKNLSGFGLGVKIGF
ncbi:MAG: hypothetical protein GY906_20965 [bacterium]|nr:hypothetical protein [bacterium]